MKVLKTTVKERKENEIKERTTTKSPISSTPAAAKRLKRKILRDEIHSLKEKLVPELDIDLAGLFASTIVSCPDQGKK